MATPTTQQLIDIEKNSIYKEQLRMNILGRAAYYRGLPHPPTLSDTDSKDWYQGRALAENMSQTPQNSIDQAYYSSRSMAIVKTLDLTGVDANSDMPTILAALEQHYAYISVQVYTQEQNKQVFSPL